MKKLIVFCFSVIIYSALQAQVSDDFSDGNFTVSPSWGGSASSFIIDGSNQLQSNGSTSGDEIYLSTENSLIDSVHYEFYLHLDFNPTGTGNFVKIFLASDQSDLTASLNGYFLRLGETGSSDTLELWRQDTGSETKILTGSKRFTSTTDVAVRVVRDHLGNWELFTDHSAGTNYTSEGSVLDATHTVSTHFGVYCKYSTGSRFDQYLFDNINIEKIPEDLTPPSVDSVSIISSTELDVYFSESVTSVTAQNVNNYSVNNSIGVPVSAVRDAAETNMVHLTFSSAFSNGESYSIACSNIQDSNSNIIETNNTDFFYLVTVPAALGDVVINEVFPDPNPQVGLPSSEYLELLNTSNNIFNLKNWNYVNSSSAKTIDTTFYLYPNSYVILCPIADTATFTDFGDVIGITGSWTALSNSADSLTIVDEFDTVIDIVKYDVSWYQDDVKEDGGYSLELINPEAICSGGANNWTASNDVSGGTPGQVNSVFDNSPDLTSPDLISIDVLSDTSILLTFSEPMDTSSILSETYSITGNISVTDVSLNASTFTDVILYLSNSIDTSVTYIVSATNVTDCPGNSISINNSVSFAVGYTPLKGEVIINEIFADPSPAIAFPNGEFVELFNKTDKLFDISGYNFDGATISSGFIEANGYVTLCHIDDTAGFNLLGKTIGLSSFPSLTNAGELIIFEAPDGTTIDAVEYNVNWHSESSKEDGGWSLELINPENPCSGANNWTSSTSFDGATPGIQNSVYDTSLDASPPELSGVEVTGSTFIVASFNEPIDTNELFNLNISTTPILNVNSVGVTGFVGDKIFIGFTTDIDTAVEYTIQIANMEDCIGNVNTSGSATTFEIGYAPEAGDIIINELFIDPSPIVGLPEAEYIELYNKSDKKIDLSNAEINGKAISYYLLEPNSYVILIDDDDSSLFNSYSNIASLSSWYSLNNTSMELTLTNLSGTVIDHVYYFSSWYNNEDKDGGGWSLERKNPDSECNFANNWDVSTDENGGTPGKQNSVYNTEQDNVNPFITKIEVIDSLKINVLFSESMDVSSFENGEYIISNNLNAVGISVNSSDYASVILTLEQYLIPGELQTLTIANISDCPGNKILNTTSEFVLPQQGEEGDLIINEVLFNPTSNGQDFVEIYNNSDKYIDLGTWFLANFEDDSIANIKVISDEQQIIAPAQFYAITKDSSAVKYSYPLSTGGNYIQATTLPTYGNNDGVVILLNNNFDEMDRLDYDENMHFAILNDADGVSLERIDFNRETNEETNWHSAAQNASFATPGLPNSQFQPANPGENVLTIEPDIFSPDEDGYNDVLNISYLLEAPGYVGNIMIYDTKGRLVRKLMSNEYLSPQGTISWDGKTDNAEKARIGLYIILAEFYNDTGDIIKSKKSCVLGTNL